MDRKEALRILNLIGVKSEGQAELRYLQLSARIEILIQSAETAELKQVYLETARSLEEAYQVLTRNKESKLIATASVVRENWSEPDSELGDAKELLFKMKAALQEVQQIRTHLQQYAALLEVKLAHTERVLSEVQSEREALDNSKSLMRELQAAAERTTKEIAMNLEETRQLATEMRRQKRELAELVALSTAKGRFLDVITGRARQTPPPNSRR